MTLNNPHNFFEHYHLSKHTRDDAPQIAESLSNPLIAGQLRYVPEPYTLSHALIWFDRLDEDQKTPETAPFRWAIRETSSGKFIGDISLKIMEEGKYQLGYWLAHEYWGQGIMTSAIAAVLEIVEKENPKVKAVVASVKEGNYGSRRVVEKNGFSFVGQHKECTGEDAYWSWDFGRDL